MQWVAATHITVTGEPDLVGYFIWAIFLSLGFFTALALDQLAVLDRAAAAAARRALARFLRLGRV